MRLMRPPKDAQCDFHVGAELDSLGAPVVRRCPNVATVTGVPKTGGSEVWMCEGCWEKRSEMFARRVPAEAQGASSHG